MMARQFYRQQLLVPRYRKQTKWNFCWIWPYRESNNLARSDLMHLFSPKEAPLANWLFAYIKVASEGTVYTYMSTRYLNPSEPHV